MRTRLLITVTLSLVLISMSPRVCSHHIRTAGYDHVTFVELSGGVGLHGRENVEQNHGF